MVKHIWTLLALLLSLGGTAEPASLANQIFNTNNLQDLDKFGGIALFARDFIKKTWPDITYQRYVQKLPKRLHISRKAELWLTQQTPTAAVNDLQRLAERATELCKLPQVNINPASLTIAFDSNNKHTASVSAASDTIFIERHMLSQSHDKQDGILAHELMHIKYKDCLYGAWARLFIPLATIATGYGTAYWLPKLCTMPAKVQKIIQTILTSHCCQYYCNGVAYAAYIRYGEKRADIKAAELTKTGDGLYQYFNQEARGEDSLLKMEADQRSLNRNMRKLNTQHFRLKCMSFPKYAYLNAKSYSKDLLNSFRKTHAYLHRTHPTATARANYLRRYAQ